MIASSLAGLLVLNVLFLLVGTALLWAVRGWAAWREYLVLIGVAYVLGLASVCVLSTVVLVFGGSLSRTSIAIVLLVPTVAAVGIGRMLGRRLPRAGNVRWLVPSRGSAAPFALATATASVLYELYRVMQTQPLVEWDAWSFWIPKAKAIYFFGGLDLHVFREVGAGSYPLLVPALDAMDFSFMGSPDTTTLGVQYWLLLVGFALAAAALLRGLAAPALVWLFLATAVSLPTLDQRLPTRIADWPLDIFFALAALAVVRWLATDEHWLLAFAAAMLAAVIATKREGLILVVAALLAGSLAAGWRRWRRWLPLAGISAAAYLVNLPWTFWWRSHHLGLLGPPGGVIDATFHLSRAPASFWLVLRLLFSYGHWGIAAPVALASAVAAARSRRGDTVTFFLVSLVLGIVGFAWVNWSDVTLPITTDPALNPPSRALGALILLSLTFTPLLLQPVFDDLLLLGLHTGRRGRLATPAPSAVPGEAA